MIDRFRTGAGLLAVLVLITGFLAGARAEEETGWSDTAELSFVLTSGNSESTTLGFKNTALRKWTNALFTLKAGGIRVETTSTSRAAVTSDPGLSSFAVQEITSTEKTAENYYLNGRYDRNISERLFWFAGAGWDRNRFAGVENRYVAEGGVGNVWRDEEDLKFRTLYGLTYTDQEDVVMRADVDDSFVGARFAWEYLNKLSQNTTYENTLILDLNLDESDDWRGDMIQSVAVAMSERLALKLSLQWLYDNLPSLVDVPLLLENPPGTLNPTGETRAVELDELDTLFTASLVVSF